MGGVKPVLAPRCQSDRSRRRINHERIDGGPIDTTPLFRHWEECYHQIGPPPHWWRARVCRLSDAETANNFTSLRIRCRGLHHVRELLNTWGYMGSISV